MLAGGLFRGGGGATVAAPGTVGGPEGEVVPEELHDEGGVLVALLVERVQLRYGVVEGLKRRRKNHIPTGSGSGLGKPLANFRNMNSIH